MGSCAAVRKDVPVLGHCLGGQLMSKAFGGNPYYINAWLHLARCPAVTSNFDAAYECLERERKLKPMHSTGWRSCARRGTEDTP